MSIFRRFWSFFGKLYDREADALPLGLFRIGFCIVQLLEIQHIKRIFPLIASSEAHSIMTEFNSTLLLRVWMVVTLLLLFGVKTRYTVWLNYLLCLFTISSFTAFEYHYDYFMIGTGFLFLFIPIGRSLSIDSALDSARHFQANGTPKPPATVPVLLMLLPLFFGPGLMYFDSVFSKLNSTFWLDGYGFWMPASVINAGIFDAQGVLDFSPLNYVLSWLTLLFEFLFVFLMWFRPFRVPLMFIGLGLHISIAIVFPIPLFGLGYATVFLLFLNGNRLRKMAGRLRRKQPSLQVEYNPNNPNQRIAIGLLQGLDWMGALNPVPGTEWVVAGKPARPHAVRNVLSKLFPGILLLPVLGIPFLFQALVGWLDREPKGNPRPLKKRTGLRRFAMAFILVTFFIQVLFVYGSDLSVRLHAAVGAEAAPKAVRRVVDGIISITKPSLGLYYHSLFVEQHFAGYNHLLGLECVNCPSGTDTWVPMLNRDGSPGEYMMGRSWAYYTFRTCGPLLSNQRPIGMALANWAALWAGRQGIPIQGRRFRIMARYQDVPTQFTVGYRESQRGRPWRQVGEIVFAAHRRPEIHIQMLNIEALPAEFFENPAAVPPAAALQNAYGLQDTVVFSAWLDTNPSLPDTNANAN